VINLIDSIIILASMVIIGYLLFKLIFPKEREENIFVRFSLMIVLLVLSMSYLNVIFKIHPSREILFMLLLFILFLIFLFQILRSKGILF
jgi:hypothetical protein